MASSGSFNTSGYEGRYLTFSWTETSQNIANNTTTISWTLKGAGGSTGKWYNTQNIKVTLDGKTVFTHTVADNGQIKVYNGTTVATGTYTFTHNSDGTKSFTAYVEAGIYVWAPANATGSKTFTLDTIARASQPSCITWPEHTQNVGKFGDEISIHMNRKADTMTHTVRYQFGSNSGTIATNVTTGTTWVIPLSLMNLIPNSTSGSGTIYVDTYNGSTKIGTKSCGFTATVPTSVKPSLSVTLEDIAGIDDIYGSPVKGLSKIKITPAVTLAYSSPIASYTITANGVTYNTSTATTGFLTTTGDSKVTVTVKDKRGRSATWTYTMTVLDYTAPTISKLTVKRCDQDGTENDQGEYAQATFSAAISSMGSKNTATFKLQYKKSSDTTWTTKDFTTSGKYTVTSQTHVFAADGNSSYDVEVVATDRHSTAIRSTSVSTAFTLYNCHSSGTGIRFGGVAEKENLLQNDLPFRQVKNSYAFQASSSDGVTGFNLLATININMTNVSAPIVFELNKHSAKSAMTVYVSFVSSSTTTDPNLRDITYTGDNFGIFLVKAATSTWKLYMNDLDGWAIPCVQRWYTTAHQSNRISVIFRDEKVQGSDPSVLGTYYRATPTKMQSLLDFIYPVGSIYHSYSHVSPAELFGGTWTRIQNAFLWACGSTGDIGITGGESTHTLTISEMPSHSHKAYKWYTRGTTNQYVPNVEGQVPAGYLLGTDSVGGGAAHNNMPPYVQVSVWRRTA